MHTHAFKAGQSLRQGAYEIIKVLGQGGFGITYLARFTSLDRLVAIKEFFISGYCVRSTTGPEISPQAMQGPDFETYKAKFIDEARTLAQFSHPAIVPVTDIFEENNTAYFVMQYIEGASLADMIQRMGPLPEADARGYIRQAAEALQWVHTHKLLHRDIKPDNLMIKPDGQVVLIDFGTARSFVDNKTITHTTLLTPGYAPLEQYSDRQQRGFYTDIYALGATLYTCLTGEAPPPAVDRLQQAKLPHLPAGALGEVIAKAMAMQPSARYQSSQEMLADLQTSAATPATDSAPTLPKTAPPPPSQPDSEPVEVATEWLPPAQPSAEALSPKPSRPLPWGMIAIASVCLILASGGFWGWQQLSADQKAQYEQAMQTGAAAFEAGEFDRAVEAYESAQRHDDQPEAKAALAKAQNALEAQAVAEAKRRAQLAESLAKGDRLFQDGQYTLAKITYQTARTYAHPDSLGPVDQKIAACQIQIDKANAPEAKLQAVYLGEHPLTLQWISWDYTGSATFYEEDGVVKLKGEQLSRESTGDYVKLSGTVELISEQHFVLDGTVRMKINHINDGRECVRKGKLTFKASGERKYWRMREMDSPCDVTTDYVDIYFRKL